MQTIGERLEEARKKKGISIREAAEATKIRGDYLQKFEGNHFDIGLTEIYTRGFLRNYANFLKIPSDRILNDYAALGRGDTRPRQPSREVYGRMDISVASAGEPSDRAAPPEEGAAEAEPARAQPHYPRGRTNLPSGPDPAVIFRYAKWAGAVIALLLVIWGIVSFVGSRSSKSPSTTGQSTTPPPVAATPPATTRATITALDVVRVQVWAKDDTVPAPNHGRELLAPIYLARGETATFEKNGPVIVLASEQANVRVDFSGKQYIPGAPPANLRGAVNVEIP